MHVHAHAHKHLFVHKACPKRSPAAHGLQLQAYACMQAPVEMVHFTGHPVLLP